MWYVVQHHFQDPCGTSKQTVNYIHKHSFMQKHCSTSEYSTIRVSASAQKQTEEVKHSAVMTGH